MPPQQHSILPVGKDQVLSFFCIPDSAQHSAGGKKCNSTRLINWATHSLKHPPKITSTRCAQSIFPPLLEAYVREISVALTEDAMQRNMLLESNRHILGVGDYDRSDLYGITERSP